MTEIDESCEDNYILSIFYESKLSKIWQSNIIDILFYVERNKQLEIDILFDYKTYIFREELKKLKF